MISKSLVLPVVSLVVIAFVVASVFTYYPLVLQVSPATPQVLFDYGSNANQPDISGNIQVTVGQNGTSATITIHPTYQVTYYEKVLLIKNTDTKAYNVYLVIDQATKTLPTGSKVVLYIYSQGATRDLSGWPVASLVPASGTYVKAVDLTATGANSPQQIGTLNGGSAWEVDILVYIPEGTQLPANPTVFNMYLIASPESTSPP